MVFHAAEVDGATSHGCCGFGHALKFTLESSAGLGRIAPEGAAVAEWCHSLAASYSGNRPPASSFSLQSNFENRIQPAAVLVAGFFLVGPLHHCRGSVAKCWRLVRNRDRDPRRRRARCAPGLPRRGNGKGGGNCVLSLGPMSLADALSVGAAMGHGAFFRLSSLLACFWRCSA